MASSLTLFKMQSVDAAFVERREAMERQYADVSDEKILSGDIDELSRRIAMPFQFDVPDVLVNELKRDETTFDRNSANARITWYIPIRGDYNILGYNHRNSPLSPVYTVSFENNTMVVTTNTDRDRITDSKKTIDAILVQIEEYLPGVKQVLEIYNARLIQFARLALEERLADILAIQKAQSAISQLAVPVRKRADEVAKVFTPPARKKAPAPAVSKDTDVIPVLEMQAYDDILSTITAMSHGIERSPETFEGMGEEDIRIVLLIGLNAIYEGMATGETFNGSGKSDILIRVADKNIFIAECLVWDGEAKFRKKLEEQLLKYAVWRDTKTALIVFNRKKNLTAVVRTIDVLLSKHRQFVRKFDSASETQLRYEFRKADDPERHFYLTCLAFTVPEKVG